MCLLLLTLCALKVPSVWRYTLHCIQMMVGVFVQEIITSDLILWIWVVPFRIQSKRVNFQRMKYRMPCQHTSCLIHYLGKTSRVTQKTVLGFSEVSKEKLSLLISLLCHDTPLRSGLKTICFPKIFKFFPSEGDIKTIQTPSFVGVKVLSVPCTSLVLIVFHWWHFLRPIQKGWLAIAKLKPLSLFIPLF